MLIFQGWRRPCLASKFHYINSSHTFHPNYFIVVNSDLPSNLQSIRLSFRIFPQAYCHVTKKQFVLHSFMKKYYLNILDLLQTVATVVKLQEKSHQRRLLIYLLCCYPHSGRKLRIILRICKFSRISWICKNRKNFAEYFMLVYYGLSVLSTARIKIKNNLIFTYPPW